MSDSNSDARARVNDEEDMKQQLECAMNHLRYYPDVWYLLEERTRLEKETDIKALLSKETTPEGMIASCNIILLDLIGREIKCKISEIIRDIESGIPLRGICKICSALPDLEAEK